MAMTDISGPLAHQLPLHNHRGGLVQPSLVMNHHLDMECHGNDIRISKSRFYALTVFNKIPCVAFRPVGRVWARDEAARISVYFLYAAEYKLLIDKKKLFGEIVIVCECSAPRNCDCA